MTKSAKKDFPLISLLFKLDRHAAVIVQQHAAQKEVGIQSISQSFRKHTQMHFEHFELPGYIHLVGNIL